MIFLRIQSLELIKHHQVIWVPRHYNIDDNEMAKECAVIVTSLDVTMSFNDVYTLWVDVANKIKDWAITTR